MTDSPRVRKARIVLDNEVWEPTVGQKMRMVGRYITKPRIGKEFKQTFETSSTTALAIIAATKTAITDGKGGIWAIEAQVHDVEVLEYFEE